MLGHRQEHVRKYVLHYRNLIEKQLDISSVSYHLLDSSFDLASWMFHHSIGDQIDSARRIREQTKAVSSADMRRTRHELNVESPLPSEGVADAMLLQAGTKIPLKEITRIGRKPENDFVLNDPDVSGQHAQIRWDQSAF